MKINDSCFWISLGLIHSIAWLCSPKMQFSTFKNSQLKNFFLFYAANFEHFPSIVLFCWFKRGEFCRMYFLKIVTWMRINYKFKIWKFVQKIWKKGKFKGHSGMGTLGFILEGLEGPFGYLSCFNFIKARKCQETALNGFFVYNSAWDNLKLHPTRFP